MGDTFNPEINGHAAGKNGQELGLQNEYSLLNCIKTEGWVREFEASLITGMSLYMIGVVSRRLAENGEILREQSENSSHAKTKNPKIKKKFEGNTGFFLRLTASGARRVNGKTGKDVKIPDCWRHHAMAIQTLYFLSIQNNCKFESEKSMLHRSKQTGKHPDGQLISSVRCFYEQERTHKSGKNLFKQTKNIVNQAASGTTCYIGYPYPTKICDVNHELLNTNSIRRLWGNCDTALIKLVRCYFDSLIAYKNMHVSRFEIIDLPQMFNTAASRKKQSNNSNKIIGFKWCVAEHFKNDGSRHIHAVLNLGDEIQFEGIFIEGMSGDDNHILEVPAYGSTEITCADLQSFDDFVRYHQTKIVRAIEGDLKMCAMQIKANEEEA